MAPLAERAGIRPHRAVARPPARRPGRQTLSTAIVAVVAGLVATANQDSIMAGLPLVAGLAGGAAIAAVLYRRRGILATWVACLVAGLLIDGMAARSLEDPELAKLGNMAFTLIVALLALGLWGIGKVVFAKRDVAPVMRS